MAALHKRVDEEDHDGHDHEGVKEARVLGDAREALGAAGEVKARTLSMLSMTTRMISQSRG